MLFIQGCDIIDYSSLTWYLLFVVSIKAWRTEAKTQGSGIRVRLPCPREGPESFTPSCSTIYLQRSLGLPQYLDSNSSRLRSSCSFFSSNRNYLAFNAVCNLSVLNIISHSPRGATLSVPKICRTTSHYSEFFFFFCFRTRIIKITYIQGRIGIHFRPRKIIKIGPLCMYILYTLVCMTPVVFLRGVDLRKKININIRW